MSLTVVCAVLSVTVIQGQKDCGVNYTHTQICGLKRSTVEINCTYSFPSRVNGRDTVVEKTHNEPVVFNQFSSDSQDFLSSL
ncbi:hypothetical protein INR49_018285 [Caranx melampygus]|nr:hypothetical protein INR49_018285 [Caranx melampygus]